jgi:hypothetical protein
MLSKKLKYSLLSLSCILLFGCGEGESEVAKNIKFKVGSGVLVLPTKLAGASSEFPGTCVSEDVSGPRVRLSTSLVWSGTEIGNLLPFVVELRVENNPALDSAFKANIGPGGNTESISIFFGVSTDYIVPDPDAIRSSSICFLDYGSLPKPKVELAGNSQLKVQGKVFMYGIARKSDGTELPFVKETKTEFIYTGGSIPIQ